MRYFRRRGVTLIEVLIAVGVLGITVSGMLFLFARSTLSNENSRNLTVAASHAQFVMEGISNSDLAEIYSDIEAGEWNWDSEAIENKGLKPLGNEEINTEADFIDAGDLLHVIVTVSWQNLEQKERSFALETFFGDQ